MDWGNICLHEDLNISSRSNQKRYPQENQSREEAGPGKVITELDENTLRRKTGDREIQASVICHQGSNGKSFVN